MSDLRILAAALATELKGELSPVAERDARDLAWIDFNEGERAGLRIVLRRGYNSEATRIRATLSLGNELRRPNMQAPASFYALETAAAMSRSADVIARQIVRAVIEPAMPMLATWKAEIAKEIAIADALAAQVVAFRKAFPSVRVDDPRPGAYSTEIHASGAAGYITADLNSDGGLYVKRASFDAASAAGLLAAFIGKAA